MNSIYFFLKKIKQELDLASLNSKWKTLNKHNHTSLGNICNIDCICVGRETYGVINAYTFDHKQNESVGLIIGNFCSIADNVSFLLAGEHDYSLISTFPFRRFRPYKKKYNDSISKGKIIIDDDVWIGFGSIILSGVHIGKGAVIAAGAVIANDIPPYAIVGGVPAKVIKYRFTENIIKSIKNLDYSKLLYSDVENNPKMFYESISSEDDCSAIEQIQSREE